MPIFLPKKTSSKIMDTNEIRQLVASGDVEKALENLLAHTGGTSHHTLVVQLAERFNTLKNNVLKGVISFENANLERNQIANSLLELLEDQKTKKITSQLNWKKAGALLAVVIGALAGIAELSGYSLRDIFSEKPPATTESFPLTVFVHGKGGPQDMILRQQGKVVIDFPGGERRDAPIRENGEAFFQNLPPTFHGKKVRLNVDFSEPYKSIFPDSLYVLLPNEQIYLPVALLGLDKIAGTVIWNDTPLPGVTVNIGSAISDTTDPFGYYELHIPELIDFLRKC